MNDAATFSPEAWAALPFVGVMPDGKDGWLELRNVPSGTTLSRPVRCSCGRRAAWECGGLYLCGACSIAWGLQ